MNRDRLQKRMLCTMLIASCVVLATCTLQAEDRRLPMKTYVDKMKAGWIGQMCGVGWGAPTEFKFRGMLIPQEKMPKWAPQKVNQFSQDDIYVEMTFMRTLEEHGLDVSIRQAGIDFANSGYRLWHANVAGRNNLRKGIAPPDSGHPKFNKCADDIDYQIEADYSGLIAPGMPNLVIELGDKFGRIMNYGDGMYAGQFVGGMYAEAFFTDDMIKIIKAGLACIPAESQYAEMVRDMLAWYKKNPDDWKKTWDWVEEKYHKNPDYHHVCCSKHGGKNAFSIDAKLNGAYILMGLLYGKGDLDQTILISMQCGQDSDCNPANSGGILATTIGFDKLPERFTSALNPAGKFSHTPYDFPGLIEASKKIVREAVKRDGGKVEKDADGNETLVIPVKKPKPSELLSVYKPGPIAESRFTEEEMKKIAAPAPKPRRSGGGGGSGVARGKVDISKAVAKTFPGWSVGDCGSDMKPGLRAKHGGRENVLMTHPMSTTKPCTLSRKVEIPAGKKTTLTLDVGNDARGDWTLVVRGDGKELLKKKVAKAGPSDGWMTVTVDLSPMAGKTVNLQLDNAADGWSHEAAYWSKIDIDSK